MNPAHAKSRGFWRPAQHEIRRRRVPLSLRRSDADVLRHSTQRIDHAAVDQPSDAMAIV
jgi:hypothetical protein